MIVQFAALLLLLLPARAVLAKTETPLNNNNNNNQPSHQQQSQRELIFGGEQTTQTEYPYFVRFDLEVTRDQVCGGVLVAPDMVLTHPLCPPLLTEARVGFYNQNDRSTEEALGILETYQHPSFDAATFDYGFLLVKLASASSKPLPVLNNDPDLPAVNTPMRIMGTGNQMATGLGNRQTALDDASVPFIEKDTCEQAKSNGGFTYEGTITETVLCAGSDTYGACEDDWGGPLIVEGDDDENDTVVGIFAWTYGCGPTPSVFSKVSAGYDWLRYSICTHSDNPPGYLDCGFAPSTEPQVGAMESRPTPPNPINFKWTFTPDDFNFEYSYALFRVEGLSVRKIDWIVPGGIPFDFGGTFERTVELSEGALYCWVLYDSTGDGLSLDDGGATLFLEKADGTFDEVHAEDTSFNHGMAHLFYATLGEVENPYYANPVFSEEPNAFLKMEIEFDDYPGEIGWQLATESGELIYYRPPFFYYTRQPASESFSVKEARTNYVLTVVDTYGDGLIGSRTSYTILDPENNVLAESAFRDLGEEQKTFTFGATPAGSPSSAGEIISVGVAVALISIVGTLCVL